MSSNRVTLEAATIQQLVGPQHHTRRGNIFISVPHETPNERVLYYSIGSSEVSAQQCDYLRSGECLSISNSQLEKPATLAVYAMASGGPMEVIVTETI